MDVIYTLATTTPSFTTPEWVTNLDVGPIQTMITDLAAKFGPAIVICAALGGGLGLLASYVGKLFRAAKK